jgi:hypothetical protein
MQSGITLFATSTNIALRERIEKIDYGSVFALPSLHQMNVQPQDGGAVSVDEGVQTGRSCSSKDLPKLPSARIRRKKKLSNS